MPTRELTYPGVQFDAHALDVILRASIAQGATLMEAFFSGAFSSAPDESSRGSSGPYVLPYRATFHGVIAAAGAREYDNASAYSIGLLSPGWVTAAFSLDVGSLFVPLAATVAVSESGSRVEISGDEAVVSLLIEAAEEAARGAIQRSSGVTGKISRLRPRALRSLRPILTWGLGIVSALGVAYLVYRFGWTG